VQRSAGKDPRQGCGELEPSIFRVEGGVLERYLLGNYELAQRRTIMVSQRTVRGNRGDWGAALNENLSVILVHEKDIDGKVAARVGNGITSLRRGGRGALALSATWASQPDVSGGKGAPLMDTADAISRSWWATGGEKSRTK